MGNVLLTHHRIFNRQISYLHNKGKYIHCLIFIQRNEKETKRKLISVVDSPQNSLALNVAVAVHVSLRAYLA
jgi:hypothetical protein